MGARKRQGQVQVLVRWLGYDSSQDSWEPVDAIRRGCPQLVRAYALEHPGCSL